MPPNLPRIDLCLDPLAEAYDSFFDHCHCVASVGSFIYMVLFCCFPPFPLLCSVPVYCRSGSLYIVFARFLVALRVVYCITADRETERERERQRESESCLPIPFVFKETENTPSEVVFQVWAEYPLLWSKRRRKNGGKNGGAKI